MIDTIISDLGQVILDFDNTIFLRKMSQSSRRSVEEIRAAAYDNLELLDFFERGEITPLEFYGKIKTVLEIDVSYADFYAAYGDVFSLNRPILEIFSKLKPKYKLVMISNTDIMRFSFIKSRFPEIFIFGSYVLSFERGRRKPDPEIYKDALMSAGAAAEEAVFIDDIRENIEAAESLGIRGILFAPQTDLEAELGKHGVKAF